MRRLFTLLLIVCIWTCMSQKVMAMNLYLKGAYNSGAWEGTEKLMTSNGNIYTFTMTSLQTADFRFRFTGDNWKGEICPYQDSYTLQIEEEYDAKYTNQTIDNKSMADHYFVVKMTEGISYTFKVDYNNSAEPKVSYSINDSQIISYDDTEFEMVAEYGGKSLTLPLICSRNRKEVGTNEDMSSTLFTVGFKDELLPGVVGDEVKVYVRGKNNHNAQFRPSANGSSLGERYSLLDNTSLTDLRNETYITGATAANSDNTFIIKKGSGVSYTVGLNIGDAISASVANGTVSHPVAYEIKANSLTFYTNKSLDDFYGSLFSCKDTYKNKKGVTKKENLEDYYIFGTIYGIEDDDSEKGGYMSPQVSRWTKTTTGGYKISNYFKMEKQIYLNPNDKSVVDSIVYSKSIAKPKSGYVNLYMTFAPQSLIESSHGSFGLDKKAYTDEEKWNYVIRPEVFEEKNGTAVKGSVFVSGVTNNSKRNGEQSLNPAVDDDKDHYIIRLNTTTSTYRVEFVNAAPIVIKSNGIRTFVSRFNYRMPENSGVAAYAVQSFTPSTNKELNGQPNGTLNLRRLKFIPANEPVVLIYNTKYEQYRQKPSESADPVTLPLEEITGGANDPDGFLELTTQEDWWYKTDYPASDDYNNLLVGVLDDEVIENGKYHMVDNKYHYDYRHFALNLFSKTKYYKENNLTSGNYIGFFRAKGKVPAGNAYLRLTDEDLPFDGQILGDVNSGLDVDPSQTNAAPSKFSFSFDIEPWDDVTAIQEVKSQVKQDDAYYTLQGVKVAHPTKGIYIHNGKKMIIK